MMEYLIETPKEKHFRKAHAFLNYLKNNLQLTDDMHEMAYDYYKKAYAYGFPRRQRVGALKSKVQDHFYVTECTAACIYVAALERGKKYEIQDPFKRKREYRNITAKDIQKALNQVILNTEYKTMVISRRIETCARLIVNELGLKVKVPETTITNYDKLKREIVLRYRIKNEIKMAMSDIHDKLRVRCFNRALDMLEYYIKKKKIDVSVRGQARKPEVVASAFIYLACKKTKENITLKRLKEATGVNHESLQKVFKDINKEKIFPKSH